MSDHVSDAGHAARIGDSAEHVAFRLFELILQGDPPKLPAATNAAWILGTYARCLRTVKNPEASGPKASPYQQAAKS